MSLKLQKDAAREGSIHCILYKQLFVHPKPIPSSVSLTGRTAIITGANSGLGFEAGRQLLELGLSQLVMAVRSQEKGITAASELRRLFPRAAIEVSILDMDDYDSTTAFANRCQNLNRIDIVILNAGRQNRKFEICPKTGHESVFQTNYLSTALLAILLTQVMSTKKRHNETGKPPVLSVVGSDTMYMSKMEPAGPIISRFDDLARFKSFQQYMDSKLMLMMFVSKLAEQVSPDDVIINVCNPGLTSGTNLGGNIENPGFMARHVLPLFVKALGRPLRVGASTYIDAAVIEGQESHGSFVSDWTIKPYPPIMYAAEGQGMKERLWQETMVELHFAGAASIVSQSVLKASPISGWTSLNSLMRSVQHL